MFQRTLKGCVSMKKPDEDIIGQAKEAIRACFLDVPFSRVELDDISPANADKGFDLIGRITTSESERVLVVEVKSNGQPRWARGAVGQLSLYRNKNPGAYCIFVAPYISDETAQIIAENDMGYIDLAGNCRVTFDQVYIRRDGRENKLNRKRDLRSLYSPKAERVLRVLLSQPKREWRVEELAREADVSLGQASNVKKLLEDREWLKRGASGFAARDPRTLLAEWSKNYRAARNTNHPYFSLDPVGVVEEKIARHCEQLGVRYALAGFSGAARLAPAVRYQRANVYVGSQIDEVAGALGLKPVTSGANVTLTEPYDDGVFIGASKIGETTVASPVQVYLDLLGSPGRGNEAAEALLREVIEPSW